MSTSAWVDTYLHESAVESLDTLRKRGLASHSSVNGRLVPDSRVRQFARWRGVYSVSRESGPPMIGFSLDLADRIERFQMPLDLAKSFVAALRDSIEDYERCQSARSVGSPSVDGSTLQDGKSQ